MKKDKYNFLSCIFTVLLVVPRSSDQRLALVDRFTKSLSLLTDPDDIVLNFVTTSHGVQSETESLSDLVHKEAEGKMSQVQKLILKSKPNLCFVFKLNLISNCLLSQNPKRKILLNRGALLQNRCF